MVDFNVFVSHSHKDSNFCLRLVNALLQRIPNIDIFYDETTIRGGEAWMERMFNEVLSRPIFIVVLSSESVKAHWVREETNMAIKETVVNRGTRWVIPVRIERCDVKLLSPWLSFRQIIDFAGNPEGPALDELVDAILRTSQQPEDIFIESGDPGTNKFQEEREHSRQVAANIHSFFSKGAYRNVLVIGESATGDPDNQFDAELWAEVGYSYLEIGRREQDKAKVERAIELLDTASKINSKRADIWRWLAEAQSLSGNVTAAVEIWIKALNWSDSPERMLGIYADICKALHDAGQEVKARDFANAAKEIAEVSEVAPEFEFGREYWQKAYGQQAVSSAIDRDRTEAFHALQAVIADLASSGRQRKFPSVVLGLQQHGIHHSNFGYSRFTDFIVDAEKARIVKVVWLAENSQVYLPTEEIPLRPVQQSKSPKPQNAAKPSSQADEGTVAMIVDRLEMGQTYISSEKVVEYFKKKHPHLAATARDLLGRWQASGDILTYTTEPMYLDGTGQAVTKSAIRLNPESAQLQALIQATYAASPSSWIALDSATKEYVMSTLKLLADELPFLTWNHLRTLLSKQDKETDWDTAIATAIRGGIMTATLCNVESQTTHAMQTVKSLSLNNANAEVTATVAHAASNSNQDSGWQYARRSLARLFNIG